jgi:hypothetical protein
MKLCMKLCMETAGHAQDSHQAVKRHLQRINASERNLRGSIKTSHETTLPSLPPRKWDLLAPGRCYQMFTLVAAGYLE